MPVSKSLPSITIYHKIRKISTALVFTQKVFYGLIEGEPTFGRNFAIKQHDHYLAWGGQCFVCRLVGERDGWFINGRNCAFVIVGFIFERA